MIVPNFNFTSTNNTRILKNSSSSLSMDQIDVSRDLLDIKFLLKSEQDPDSIKYYLKLHSWTPKKLHIKIDFEDPSLISKGQDRDTMYMKIKNPKIFVSQSTG